MRTQAAAPEERSGKASARAEHLLPRKRGSDEISGRPTLRLADGILFARIPAVGEDMPEPGRIDSRGQTLAVGQAPKANGKRVPFRRSRWRAR
jgi:hypothetical protein